MIIIIIVGIILGTVGYYVSIDRTPQALTREESLHRDLEASSTVVMGDTSALQGSLINSKGTRTMSSSQKSNFQSDLQK